MNRTWQAGLPRTVQRTFSSLGLDTGDGQALVSYLGLEKRTCLWLPRPSQYPSLV